MNDERFNGIFQEIVGFDAGLRLDGSREAASDRAQGRRECAARKAEFFAKPGVGGRSRAQGRSKRESKQAQLFAQSHACIRGRPQGGACLAWRPEKTRNRGLRAKVTIMPYEETRRRVSAAAFFIISSG